MPQCAFCPHTGDLSREHIFSDWMEELFVGPIDATIKDSTGLNKNWHIDSNIADFAAKIVCEKCNNSWMSAIEDRAKPILFLLIKGETAFSIGPAEAHALAIFAFKTAVVIDHSDRSRSPFFSSRIRNGFRTSLAIPNFVQMWFCGYDGHRNDRSFRTHYHGGGIGPTYPIQMYVCTVAIGLFVFQVFSVKHFRSIALYPTPGCEGLAIPFWPVIPRGFTWPHLVNLSNVLQFEIFARRWERVRALPIHS
jgi:hypothetical protein